MEEEASFESKPRKTTAEWKEDGSKARLPIKLEDGSIQMQAVSIPMEGDHFQLCTHYVAEVIVPATKQESKVISKPESNSMSTPVTKTVESPVGTKTKMSTGQMQEQIGLIASTIIEDPEHHVRYF